MRHDALARITALARHNAILMLREPGPLVSRMVLPLAFVTLLHPLYQSAEGRSEGTSQAVIGTLVTFSLLALSIAGGAILTERIWHTWERLRTSAARSGEVLAGKAIPVLTAMLAQQALVLGFGVLVLGLPVRRPLLLVPAVLSWTFALAGMGAALGVLARSVGELSAAYDIGGLLLSSLGGALVPLTEMPHWIRAVAPASPGYWAVRALRGAIGGDTRATLTGSAVLLGFAVAAGAGAAWRLTRAGGRSATM
jgi:ABC-2 type transport system permease protein